jgi:hypothetical protein
MELELQLVVFTDIQGSTWQMGQILVPIMKFILMYQETMFKSLEIHNDIVRNNIQEIDSYEVKTEGDSFLVAFQDCVAVDWCLQIQAKHSYSISDFVRMLL